jgi:hypothetical protein
MDWREPEKNYDSHKKLKLMVFIVTKYKLAIFFKAYNKVEDIIHGFIVIIRIFTKKYSSQSICVSNRIDI